jgi:hypothetical protein
MAGNFVPMGFNKKLFDKGLVVYLIMLSIFQLHSFNDFFDKYECAEMVNDETTVVVKLKTIVFWAVHTNKPSTYQSCQ